MPRERRKRGAPNSSRDRAPARGRAPPLERGIAPQTRALSRSGDCPAPGSRATLCRSARQACSRRGVSRAVERSRNEGRTAPSSAGRRRAPIKPRRPETEGANVIYRSRIRIVSLKRGGLVVATAIAALVAAIAVLASTVAAGQGSSAPVVTVSPLPATRDANPQTQISFLGVAASALRDIVVVGSKSGPHTGRLVAYSTHTGGSFLPSRPFDPGE